MGYVKTNSICGTTISVRLKLACIKLGDDELGNNYFTLSQLDRLPTECQLQLANGDALSLCWCIILCNPSISNDIIERLCWALVATRWTRVGIGASC